ncbi:MAG: hypothetical protein SPK16_00940, partial [Corynebacterium sp.]|nr:hypothetical protein [Corynebacterium sp.]
VGVDSKGTAVVAHVFHGVGYRQLQIHHANGHCQCFPKTELDPRIQAEIHKAMQPMQVQIDALMRKLAHSPQKLQDKESIGPHDEETPEDQQNARPDRRSAEKRSKERGT